MLYSIEELMNIIYSVSENAQNEGYDPHIKAVCDIFIQARDFDIDNSEVKIKFSTLVLLNFSLEIYLGFFQYLFNYSSIQSTWIG